MSFTIASHTFKTKSEASRKAHNILYGYPLGERLVGDDQKFIFALIWRREADTVIDKIGVGIAWISPMLARGGRGRTFCLHRRDGSITDFSYNKSLETKNNASYVKKAARFEVKQQIEWFKQEHFSGKCEVTGEEISIETCHVDHIPPHTFDVLFARFLRSEDLPIDQVEARNVGDFQIGTVFVDRDLAARWYSYHLEHAILRIVSPHANC